MIYMFCEKDKIVIQWYSECFCLVIARNMILWDWLCLEENSLHSRGWRVSSGHLFSRGRSGAQSSDSESECLLYRQQRWQRTRNTMFHVKHYHVNLCETEETLSCEFVWNGRTWNKGYKTKMWNQNRNIRKCKNVKLQIRIQENVKQKCETRKQETMKQKYKTKNVK